MTSYKKYGYVRKYQFGGKGIFSKISNFIASKLPGLKNIAKQKAIELSKNAGKKLVESSINQISKQLNPKSKEILKKYISPVIKNNDKSQRTLSSIIDGQSIAIQDLVKKINGSGLKKTY